MHIENTKQLIESFPGIDSADKKLLLSAISTRGSHKGFILSNAPSPSKNESRWLAWQVLITNLAPMRASVWSLMFSGQKDEYKRLDDIVEKTGLAHALNAIEPPFRWNLWAHHNDRGATIKAIENLFN